MKIASLAAAALLLLNLSLPAFAGESMQSFTSVETGLVFLDPQVSLGDEQLDQLANASGMTLGSQADDPIAAAAGPVTASIAKLSDQVLGVAKGHSDKLVPYLKPYQILDKSPLRYQQIDMPSKSGLRSLVQQSNDVLKKLWRVSETVRVSEALLPTLEKDTGRLNGDAYQKAALGVVGISLAQLNLSAGQQTSQLSQEIAELQAQAESQLKSTQAAVTSNPMNALSMGEDISVLTSLTGTLSKASGQISDAGKKMPGILKSMQGILDKLV